MYLESIRLTKILPCLAEPGKIIVIGDPSRKLDEVLPYLATLPNVISYNPDSCTLTLRRQPGFISLYSEQGIYHQSERYRRGVGIVQSTSRCDQCDLGSSGRAGGNDSAKTRSSSPGHMDFTTPNQL